MDALSGGRKVFCALPQCLSSEEMVAHGRTFADACVEAHVTHVVRISSFGERIDAIRALRSNEYVPFKHPCRTRRIAHASSGVTGLPWS